MALEPKAGPYPWPPPKAPKATLTQAASTPTSESLAPEDIDRQLAAAQKALFAGDYDEAWDRLQALCRGPCQHADAPPYLGLCALMLGQANRAKELCEDAAKKQPNNAVAHAALACVNETLTLKGRADHAHRQQALSQATWRRARHQEVVAILGLSRHHARPDAPRTVAVWLLWLTALATCFVLFGLANHFDLGTHEYTYRIDDIFFWQRRFVLLGVGVFGACVWQRQHPGCIVKSFWPRISLRAVVYTTLYGVALGLLSPTQRVVGPWQDIFALSTLHVVAETVFFQGFVGRMLLQQLPDTRLAILLAGIAYGLYHLSYYSFWLEMGIEPRMYFVGTVSLFAGMPYAWLMFKSQGLFLPAWCHLCVSLSMMAHSIWARLGP